MGSTKHSLNTKLNYVTKYTKSLYMRLIHEAPKLAKTLLNRYLILLECDCKNKRNSYQTVDVNSPHS